MNTAVSERPILFSGPMVRAILAGRKTQTRRVIANRDMYECVCESAPAALRGSCNYCNGDGLLPPGPTSCPYGRAGDRLWVREAFYIDAIDGEDGPIYYRADGECCQQIPECQCASVGKLRWKPSIHMPRRICRIVLELTDVRVERLQEIKERDAVAEGFEPVPILGTMAGLTASGAFAKTWDALNADSGYSWASNRFVWALNFKVVESPSA